MSKRIKNQTSGLVVLITLLIVLVSFKKELQNKSGNFTAPASADVLKNPLAGIATATADGKKIYDVNCAVCHGAKGKGDGVAAAGLNKAPADHSSPAIQKQSDGAIFWKITEGNNPMPAYKAIFSETQRWQLVNYIRTLAKTTKK